MTKDEILSMAREAGALFNEHYGSKRAQEQAKDRLVAFGTLVAAKAAQDEREACAQVLEKKSDEWSVLCDQTSSVLQRCAGSLRARGQ